ncbi:hypothetical protein BYT27DRAFT_7126830 [Phlegmacium glaucopus]|nr:hypothetical protein BYT27DRAFT_7126830 [Phlegmacium glaucopus]
MSGSQSPWRNSVYKAPTTGRNTNEASSNARGRRPMSMFSPTTSPTSLAPTGPLPPDRDLMEGLSETLLHEKISVPKPDKDQEDVYIKGCTYIGSYNWMKGDTPTILVPGSPPQWLNRILPFTIPPDSGMFFVDQNSYRMPQAMLLPLITAVNKIAERKEDKFDWPSVDFVSDRNGLRKLMRWVGGNEVRDFRIDLQLAGEKTVLFKRWEKRVQEAYNGRTFGFSFEKASTETAPGCRDSTGHHRIITYDLNGLKMVVRFEVDACIPPPGKYPRRSVSNIDDITSSLSSISLSPTTPGSSSSTQLAVREGGSEVSSTAVVELTTRSVTTMKLHGYDWKEAYPQLFFSQTAHHILAIHQRGRFTEIQKRKLSSDDLKAVEKEAQGDLKKLRKFLDIIKKIVIAHGKKGRLSLVCVGGELKIYKRTSDESCLPESAIALFDASK